MKISTATLPCIVCLLLTDHIFAHPGHQHPAPSRVWKDKNGCVEFEATFVTARNARVLLRKPDGNESWLPLEQLCDADRTWVKQRVEIIRKLNEAAPEVESVAPSADAGSPKEWVLFVLVAALAGTVMVSLATAGRSLDKRCGLKQLVTGLATAVCITMAAIGNDEKTVPAMRKHFEPFKDKLKLRSDADYLYVESSGFPDHPMMIGITAWQQQVPIPQRYTGQNAWRIPLHPRLAEKPVSAKTALFRGAIALAVNGVPIFNPIKNDGKTDTFLAGELDEYGGHCGRADDYHYHIAPVHLEKTVGKGSPIGYALDGYPLYGYTDSNGKEPKDLDEFNGRTEGDGYRYYSTKKYPYVNGGLRGIVMVKDGQIDPQPRANPIRPDGRPLRGAKITGFTRDEEKKAYTLKYELSGKVHWVLYTIRDNGSCDFTFIDGNGKATKETYRNRRPDGKEDRPPPKKDDPPMRGESPSTKPAGNFKLTSPAFPAGGKYPVEFTGDGDGISPPLAWTGAPEGTKYYALQLWHKPKAETDEVKSYWVITNIPASVTSLEKNSRGVGKDGYNDKKRTGYDPMNSKGPGVKEYYITMYALSAEPKFTTDKVTRADLLKAIKDITLAETTLSYTYERKAK